MLDRFEQVLVEPFVSHRSVEAFDVSILLRLPSATAFESLLTLPLHGPATWPVPSINNKKAPLVARGGMEPPTRGFSVFSYVCRPSSNTIEQDRRDLRKALGGFG
jgi:hypothetical protein